jgi:hypothetical protein
MKIEITQEELDALNTVLTIALDDQTYLHDSGDMFQEYDPEDIQSKALDFVHVGNVLQKLGHTYTAGLYSDLAKIITGETK